MNSRFLSLIILLFTLLWWNSGRRSYAANPIKMEVSSPLALTEKPLAIQTRVGRWFPVAVTLTNTGDPVNGVLSLGLSTQSGNNTATSEFYTQVDLPQNAHKRVWLYGRMENEELDLGTVNLRGRAITPLSAEFSLKNAEPSTRVVLTISDSDEKLSYLSGLKGALGVPDEISEMDQAMAAMTAPNGAQNLVRPLGAVHEMVPWRWIGFDTVDLLVLQDFPHIALRPEQITAMKNYVAGGGSILMLGGADWQRLSKSPLADLWPVMPTASTVASATEVSDLVHDYVTVSKLTGADRLGGAPVMMTRGTLKSGARLRQGTASSPLFATYNSGAGQSLFLAFDPTKPPFIGWSGNANLWAEIFGATLRPRRVSSVDPNAAIPGMGTYGTRGYGGPGVGYGTEADANENPLAHLMRRMDAAQQLKTPPVSYIAWFLALYVFFLVPVNYCVLRYFDKRELAWVTVPIIVLVFSVISYAAALSIKGRAVLTRHVNLVQGSADSGAARADTILWLFSPRKTNYTITGADPQTVVADYISTEENARVTVREPSDPVSFQVENAAINMWDRRFFIGQSVIDTGQGIRVQIKGAQPAIQNNTRFDLRGAVLITGGRLRSYGDIKAGATADRPVASDAIDLQDSSLTGRIERASNLDKIFPFTSADMSGGMAQSVLPLLLGKNLAKQTFAGPMLIAWSDQPAAKLVATGETPQEQNITVFLFRLNNDALMALPARSSRAATDEPFLVDATVQPVGMESTDATPDMTSGSILTYSCELPNVASNNNDTLLWRSLSISAKGRNWDADTMYNYQYQWRRNRQGTAVAPIRRQRDQDYAVKFEIWDFNKARWQPLSTVAGGSQNTSRDWSFRVRLPGTKAPILRLADCVRQPDNLVRLRARTAHSGIKVDTVRVQATPR